MLVNETKRFPRFSSGMQASFQKQQGTFPRRIWAPYFGLYADALGRKLTFAPCAMWVVVVTSGPVSSAAGVDLLRMFIGRIQYCALCVIGHRLFPCIRFSAQQLLLSRRGRSRGRGARSHLEMRGATVETALTEARTTLLQIVREHRASFSPRLTY